MQTPVIDTHAHIVPPEMLKALRANGRAYGVEFSGSDKQTLVQLAGSNYIRPLPAFYARRERLATMDRQGIDMQILAGWVDFSAYTMPRDLGIRFAELQNEPSRRSSRSIRTALPARRTCPCRMRRPQSRDCSACANATISAPRRSRPILGPNAFSTIPRSIRSGPRRRRWARS